MLTGTVAAQNAGPAVVLSFVLAGVASIFAALCYAEFASLVPMAGSAYTYGYATLGEFVAWIIGWDLILEYALAAATVAIGWSGYVVSFLSGPRDPYPGRSSRPRAGTRGRRSADGDPRLLALLQRAGRVIVALVTTLLVIGIKESAKVNNVIVFIKVAVVLLFIALARQHVNPANWHPFIPPKPGAREHFGFSGVVAGAGVVFFAYIGFDARQYRGAGGQEPAARHADRHHRVAARSVPCCTSSWRPSRPASCPTPSSTFPTRSPRWPIAPGSAGLRQLIKIGAIAGLTSVILVQLLGQSRVFYSMSNDGLLPPFVAKIHPRFRTPCITRSSTGIAVAIPAGFLTCGSRQAGLDRDAARLRDRLRRRPGAADPGAEPAAAVQDAAGLVRGADGRAVRALPDVLSAVADLDAAAHLAGHRPGDLFRLRVRTHSKLAQPSGER